jgi:solute:Na+ symporter, SSS family
VDTVVADYAVIMLYLGGIIGVGWWGARLARTKSDYLVAGRRLGLTLYSGTMAAIAVGGASTIGGAELGYRHGISGAWLVVSIGVGIVLLHALFARRLVRLRVYTVGEMLKLRYGGATEVTTGVVMWIYTLMLVVTSSLAFATVFRELFDLPDIAGIVIGGAIVVFYSVLGGMWSITLTDIVQFAVKTIGVLILLPIIAVSAAGGFGGMAAKLDSSYFSLTSIGSGAIVTYLVTYGLGLLIGQDIWQRVFTARTPRIASLGGITAGIYAMAYGLAGALVGAAVKVIYPRLNPQDTFTTAVEQLLPAGLRGLVLAAALSAMMSTASGALIGCSTVTTTDLLGPLRRRLGRGAHTAGGSDEVRASRVTTLLLGVLAIVIATLVSDVVAALTIAYDVLVGGLGVAIAGALLWKRGTLAGATASIIAGTAAVIISMSVFGIDANAPVGFGLAASLVVYLLVSLLSPATPAEVLTEWSRRLRGEGPEAGQQQPPSSAVPPTSPVST